jgi:hypothetical protein
MPCSKSSSKPKIERASSQGGLVSKKEESKAKEPDAAQPMVSDNLDMIMEEPATSSSKKSKATK